MCGCLGMMGGCPDGARGCHPGVGSCCSDTGRIVVDALVDRYGKGLSMSVSGGRLSETGPQILVLGGVLYWLPFPFWG